MSSLLTPSRDKISFQFLVPVALLSYCCTVKYSTGVHILPSGTPSHLHTIITSVSFITCLILFCTRKEIYAISFLPPVSESLLADKFDEYGFTFIAPR